MFFAGRDLPGYTTTATVLLAGVTPERRALRQSLEQQGFRVREIAGLEMAFEHIGAAGADLLLVDATTPGWDDPAFWRRHRRGAAQSCPILLFGAPCADAVCTRALDLGADDCVAEPIAAVALAARMRALLRRAASPQSPAVWRCGDLTLDHDAHRVRRGSRAVRLGPTEYRLLALLIRHHGRVFSRDELLQRLWDGVQVEPHTIDVHIRRLRKP